jgi:hypothetical protein
LSGGREGDVLDVTDGEVWFRAVDTDRDEIIPGSRGNARRVVSLPISQLVSTRAGGMRVWERSRMLVVLRPHRLYTELGGGL